MSGPKIRTDVVDVYVFRVRAGAGAAASMGVEFLQLRRTEGPLAGTWQPVMGHVEGDEPATATAARELREEIGLDVARAACLGLWQLNGVHPFYMAKGDTIMLSPRFAAKVAADFEPRLCAEHDGWRWVATGEVEASFMWPGQRAAIGEVMREIVDESSLAREYLRVDVRAL